MVADHTVMANMGIGHDQIMVAKGGFAAILHGAAMDGDTLADHVVVANDQTSRLALILEIGGVFTHRGELIDAVVFTDPGRPLEDHMGADHCTLTNFYIGPDYRPGANDDVVSQLGTGINDGARVNQTHSLRSAQMISAEQTSLPSTLALHSNFQMLRLLLR